MSWFDTSGFSSFAKSALNQAQKSIDRVLDIDEKTNETISRPLAPDRFSVSGSSTKEASPATKQSSLSLTSRSSKSLRNTSPVKSNSNDSTSEGNSFWSSFLGDSTSNTTTAESMGSRRKTSGKKLGSRVDWKPTGKHRASKDGKQTTNTDIAVKRETSTTVTAPLASLNQDKHFDKEVKKIKKTETILEKSQAVSSSDVVHQEQSGPKLHSTTKDPDVSVQNAKLDTEEIKSTLCDTEHTELMQSNSAGKSSSSEHSENSLTENKSAFPSLNCDLRFQDSIKNDEKCTTSESQNTPLLQDAHTCTLESGENKEEKNSNDVKSALTTDLPSSTHTLGTVESATVETSDQTDEKYDSSPFAKTQCGQDDLLNGMKSLDRSKSSCGHPADEISVKNESQKKSIQSDALEYHNLLKVGPVACSTPNVGGKGACTSVNQEMDVSSSSNRHENEASFCLKQESGIDGELLCHPAGKDAETDCSEDIAGTEVIAPGDTVFDQTEEVKENTLIETSSLVESAENLVSAAEGMKHDDDQLPKELRIESKEMGVLNTSLRCREKDSLVVPDASENNTDDLRMQIEELNNEVASLKKVVEVRETKLIHLSKENMDLQEATNILRSQLEQAEAALNADDEEIDEVRQEFTVRVSAAEKKFHAAAKERDQLKALLAETETSLHSRNERQLEEFTILLKEKDDQISQLLGEGENLSKQQLQSNNIIKKLRAKEKESDALIKKSSKELEELKSENTRLTEILQANEETERKQADAITKLNAYVQKQDEQINKQKSELEDAAEKIRSMQNALDNAYKQLADLHKANASKESVAQEAVLSAEMKAKEELRIAMEKKERQLQSEMEGLELQISDLQTSLRRAEQQACRREDNLRQEVVDIQQRLQDAEARNQELTESVTHATRPLLRQIENLQSSYGNQTATWERVERNLTERLNEAQMQLVEAQEKERVATEHALDLTSRVATVEAQLSTYRQDKSRLEAAFEVERARLEAAEEAKSREIAKFETLQNKYRKMVEDSNIEKTLLEQQLAVERGKMETEKKKFQNAMDEKERRLLRQTSFSGAPSSPSPREDVLQNELPDASPSRTFGRQSSGNSIVDGIPRGVMMGAGTALVERLQAQVRQKDGEIEVLQEQITSLEKTRDSVTEELTTLTSRLETTEKDSDLLEEFKTRYKDLEQRHNAVLQMYGEKAEEAEELRMDLEDVKSMYKSQIQELLGTTR